MAVETLEEHSVPYFCWDRNLTVGQLREQLSCAAGFEWIRLAAWIMREARFADVWAFLSPADVKARMAELKPYLHRKRDFWEYIMGIWHELGRI